VKYSLKLKLLMNFYKYNCKSSHKRLGRSRRGQTKFASPCMEIFLMSVGISRFEKIE
jgi:hypothetical protein